MLTDSLNGLFRIRGRLKRSVNSAGVSAAPGAKPIDVRTAQTHGASSELTEAHASLSVSSSVIDLFGLAIPLFQRVVAPNE